MGKVIVVGGGAGGMMAAIAAGASGKQAELYEKNEKLGKKLYITGKGRCNVTNLSETEEILKNIVTNSKFMYSGLYALGAERLMDMFERELGVPLKVERGNRVFPVSDKSSDIIGGLIRGLKKYNVKISLNKEVRDIITENGQAAGVSFNDNSRAFADSVIVATGGLSYSSTGSTGDGLRWAKDTGHRVTEVFPALVPIEAEEEYVKELQGLSLKNIEVAFKNNDKVIYKAFGELLFTHFGVSGPVILSGSSYAAKYLKNSGKISIFIDLKPALTMEMLDLRILREFKDSANKDFRNSLNRLLPKSLIPVIIALSGIDPCKKVNEITREERKKLALAIKSMKLTAKGARGFDEAIITQGGISVKDINPATMESRLIKGLYFAGEVIDVDALTGGYNLQLAWSTGYLAGISAT